MAFFGNAALYITNLKVTVYMGEFVVKYLKARTYV